MSGTPRKIDSNFTDLRVAEEVIGCIGVLPGQINPDTGTPFAGFPVWLPQEPNSYGDFGSQISTVARTPIRASRQQEKGVTTDLDASVNFQVDFTEDNLYSVLQGFFFADWRLDATPVATATDEAVASANTFTGTGIDAEFAVSEIVVSSGFVDPVNNGAFLVSSVGTADTLEVTNIDGTPAALVVEANNSAVEIKRVGVQFAADDIAYDASGSFPALTSTVFDFTTLGLIPGQHVYLGGDSATTRFASAQNNGLAQVQSIAANRLEFRKVQNTPIDETTTGVTLQLFIADLLKNENDPSLIITRSYYFERSLSTAGYEYVRGCVGNTLTFNVTTADKITVDLAFIGIDGFANADRLTVGAVDELNPTAPELAAAEAQGQYPDIATSPTAFNTSSDFSRIRTATTDVAAAPLFAFITDLTLTINNNVTPTKAVGTLGAFDVTVGDFVAEGNITAYFSDVAAIQAIRNNADVTIDFFLAKQNAGWVFDVPLLTLGEGRLNVTKDEPITIPVSIQGARDPLLNTTLQAGYFPYLPTAAEA